LPKNVDTRPQAVYKQMFLAVQFTVRSRSRTAGNNTTNTEKGEKGKKKVTAVEVQKILLLKHTFIKTYFIKTSL